MGQRPSTLTPHASPRHFLGAELRRQRELRNLTAAALAERVFVSHELVQKVEKAQRRASPELIRSCDEALHTGGALGRLLAFITHTEQAPKPQPQPSQPAVPTTILIKVTAEIVSPDVADQRSAHRPGGHGGARIYTFPAPGNRTGDGQ